MPDAVNVDITANTSPDIVHDLNVRPWPLMDNEFDTVHMYDILEHLDDIVGALQEVHRVARSGARIHITVPHFSSANAYTDPTHRHQFGIRSLDYFTGEHFHDFYSSVLFRKAEARIMFESTLANKLWRRVANAWPSAYESRWAWIWPAWFVFFQLEVLK